MLYGQVQNQQLGQLFEDKNMISLFTNQTGNGSSNGAIGSGQGLLIATGTFDGATITIEVADADVAANYAPLNLVDEIFTAPHAKVFDFVSEDKYFIRATLSDAGGSTDVTLKLLGAED